jgi:hypothetical protein
MNTSVHPVPSETATPALDVPSSTEGAEVAPPIADEDEGEERFASQPCTD